jgi:hypothetical protein
MPMQLPHVRCVPIAGGVCRTSLISQEAINLLTECMWAKSPNIFTPDKLQPKNSPMNFVYEQLATPMVHLTTGKTISSYKKLMHDPATAEILQTAFGKDFGSMAQGNNKTGQKRTNSIFVMTHKEIKKIPKNADCDLRTGCSGLSTQKIGPALNPYNCRGHLDYLSWQTINWHCQSHHIQTDVEQHPQHKGRTIHVP